MFRRAWPATPGDRLKNTTTTTYVLYFDLLFEVKQLGLNWTTRYILKFGLNLRFTALYVLCVKLLVSTIAEGIYSLSVAPPYELLTEIPTFFSVWNQSHDSSKIKLQFGWKMSLMSKKLEFSSQGCTIVRQTVRRNESKCPRLRCLASLDTSPIIGQRRSGAGYSPSQTEK